MPKDDGKRPDGTSSFDLGNGLPTIPSFKDMFGNGGEVIYVLHEARPRKWWQRLLFWRSRYHYDKWEAGYGRVIQEKD